MISDGDDDGDGNDGMVMVWGSDSVGSDGDGVCSDGDDVW